MKKFGRVPVPIYNKMTTSMRIILGITYSLISVALVIAQVPSPDTVKWHSVGPVSDFEDSMLYRAESDFAGKHYESVIYGHDLNGIEKWQPGKELPTGITTLMANAQRAFQRQFPQFSQFKLMSASLLHLTIIDRWIVNVEFNGTDFDTLAPGSFEDKKINILVLLNGRVITPTVTAK